MIPADYWTGRLEAARAADRAAQLDNGFNFGEHQPGDPRFAVAPRQSGKTHALLEHPDARVRAAVWRAELAAIVDLERSKAYASLGRDLDQACVDTGLDPRLAWRWPADLEDMQAGRPSRFGFMAAVAIPGVR